MATRPCYRPLNKFVGCRSVDSAPFTWAGGFALSQKQKNVVALHEAIRKIDPSAKVLEISSKSLQPLGVSLSAFNLKFQHGGAECSVESVFQASKVFEGGIGPFPELYSHDSREVRKFVQEKSEGHRLVAFEFDGVRWDLEPKTAFYDWLYIHALLENPQLAEEVKEYDAFTDIEFNPNRQINCQAAAAALYISLCRTGRLKKAMSDRNWFVSNCLRVEPERSVPPNTEKRLIRQPKLEISYSGPQTNRQYVDRLKVSVVSSHVKDNSGKDVRKVEIKDADAAAEFARLYRPYIYGVLEKECYFKKDEKEERLVNGKIEADDVFNEVFRRFFSNKELGNLNLFKKGAGKTPFRNYLQTITKNVFSDMMRKDLVEEIGPDGKPVMVPVKGWGGKPVYETDESGNVKKDEKGFPIQKMKVNKVARYVADSKISEAAYAAHIPVLWAQRKNNVRLQKILLDIVTIAYITVQERNAKRKSWTFEAMAAIYERGEEEGIVAENAIQAGYIKDKGTFYTAKSRFDERWHKEWMKLYKQLRKSSGVDMFQGEELFTLWKQARERFGKQKNVDMLRDQIAEWALDYAERATQKKGGKDVRTRF